MLISDYNHPGLTRCVRVGSGPDVLRDQDAKLLIWRRALALDDEMAEPNWCLRLMDDWTDGLGKGWCVQTMIDGPELSDFAPPLCRRGGSRQ